MEETRSPPSSPPLEGYDTAGEEVGASSGEETTVPARLKWRKTPKKPTKRSPRKQPVRYSTRNARGRFTPAQPGRPGGSDSDIGSAADLLSVDSLTWDAHTQPLNSTIGTRRWSVETQYGVPVGQVDLLARLSPHQEGRESAASGLIEQLPDIMAELDRVRDSVERALLEAEDDILPFVRFDQEFYYLKVPASHLSSWWIWKRIPVSSYTKIVLHTNNLYLCILCGGDFIVYSDLFIGFYGFLPD